MFREQIHHRWHRSAASRHRKSDPLNRKAATSQPIHGALPARGPARRRNEVTAIELSPLRVTGIEIPYR
jgi:hypothetical protein